MYGDDRGQAVQIGAILLFGILILGLSTFQVFVVPAENKAVEFNSYMQGSEDLTEYYHDVFAAATQGSDTGESVKTGVRYPARAVLINPVQAAGAVRTTQPENVSIDGLEAVSGEPQSVRAFWDTSTRGAQNYSTTDVEFVPAYNELDASPVIVSTLGTYRLGDGGHVTLTEQPFLSGNRITLVTLAGDVDTVGVSTSLAAAPTSVATRTVTVTGTGGDDFTITVPVPGNTTLWNESAAARSVRANPNVVATAVNDSRVDVTFDGSGRYTLRLARVTVHDSSDSNVETVTAPAYVVPLTANGTQIPTEGTTELAVEVRDAYNNPVEGTPVEFATTDGQFNGGAAAETVVTGSDGQASVDFDIDGSADSATIDAAIDGAGVAPYNESTVRVVRQRSDGNSINPSGPKSLVLQSARVNTVGTGSNKHDVIDVTWENLDSTNRKNLTRLKFGFYDVEQQSSNRPPPPGSLVVDGTTLNNGGDFQLFGAAFDPDQARSFQLELYDGSDGTGGRFDPKQGDFLVVTAFIDTDGNGDGDRTSTYFIAPV